MTFPEGWKSNLIALLLSTLVVAFLLEAAFRVIEGGEQSSFCDTRPPGPRKTIIAQHRPNAGLYIETPTGLRLKPNMNGVIKDHRLSHQNIEIKTDSLGFRNAELGPKENNEIRILVLGDSITLGDYVADENTYPKQLEALLQKDLPAKKIRMINAGVGGIDLETSYHIFLEKGLLTHPDYVVIGLFHNDASPSWGILPLPEPWEHSALLSWVQKRFFIIIEKYHLRQMRRAKEKSLARFRKENLIAKGNWREDPSAFNYMIASAFGDWGYAWSEQAWQEMEGFLAEIKTLEKEHRFKLFVGLMPLRFQVESRFSNEIPQKYFDYLMKKLGIPHIDSLPAFRKSYQKSPRLFFYDYCHLTPEGNTLLASVLASELKKILATEKM